jgi:opacity protein-like surface antigen
MRALLLLPCLLGLSTVAMAQQKEGRGTGWEAGFDIIYQDSADMSFEGGSTAALEGDWGFSFAVGYRFNENLELGFGFDWQQVDYDATLRSAQLSALSIDVSGDLEAITPRAWLNYNFMPGAVTPFVTGGIGWSFIDTNIPNSRVQVGCWWDPWWGQICTPYQSTKSIDDFIYNVGAGVRWDIAPGYTLRAAYEKHWFDYGNATSTPDFDQWKLGMTFQF